jgi:hypothetical protein
MSTMQSDGMCRQRNEPKAPSARLMNSISPVTKVRMSATAMASLAAMRVRFSSSMSPGMVLSSKTCTRPHSPASGFTIHGTSSTVLLATVTTPVWPAPSLSVHWISMK